MKLPITPCCALIALAALATSADARMMGGGSMSSARVSTPSTHTSMSSSFAESRHNHFKKPIDSDGGGKSDPDPKPTTKGTGGGTKVTGGYWPPHHPHPHARLGKQALRKAIGKSDTTVGGGVARKGTGMQRDP